MTISEPSFKFTIKNTDGNARLGVFQTPHGEINTPVFMPVGTKGSVKAISQEDLIALDAEIILANTYHLYMRPGEALVKEMGKLHQFIKWPRPILTDSGGFQVFSLGGKGNSEKSTVKISDDGVQFKSHLDGSSHFFTPEKAIQIQHDLGADIIMAFDECAAANSTKPYFRKAMERTHAWLSRCKVEHEKLLKENGEQRALFGIVQGGTHSDLRAESAEFVNSLDLPGNAIGGLSVGESKEDMYAMIDATVPHLDGAKPRYLMGVGTPEDILEAVERGIDMFDCVHPTRIARHGTFWTTDGQHNIRNEKFAKDSSPLYGGYTKAYIRHLFLEKEILAMHILSMHNLHFLLDLTRKIRQSIQEGQFKAFKTAFLKTYQP